MVYILNHPDNLAVYIINNPLCKYLDITKLHVALKSKFRHKSRPLSEFNPIHIPQI